MSKYSREDIIRMVEDEDVEFIRLQFTDIFGILKNVAITASQLNKALNNDCMFDGSAIEGFVRIDESDMYLHPDLDTFEIFPWRPQQGKVARLICDVYNPDFYRGSKICVKTGCKACCRYGIYVPGWTGV